MEKRFGLRGARPKTLEAIGKEYKITRERVRQIEAEALKQLRRAEYGVEVKQVWDTLNTHLMRHGAVMAEEDILSSLLNHRERPHTAFLLHLGAHFHRVPETDTYHARWTVDFPTSALVERTVSDTVRELEKRGTPVSETALHEILTRVASPVFQKNVNPEMRDAYCRTSKIIRANPYGEYGLVSWPHVNPRGVKDKAYVALAKAAAPLHFRAVASAIEQAGWSKKRVHPQTVHNELIKDTRFVLVGRGMYGLREWGYEPGVVKDVLLSVLKNAARPLSKDEIVRLVSEKRVVKPQTIFLNLQNKNLFKKIDGGYTLV